MKNTITIFLFAIIILTLTACNISADTPINNTPTANPSSSENLQNETPTNEPEDTSSPDLSEPDNSEGDDNVNQTNNILIAYFSRAGENHNVGYIEKGNTEIVAEMIAEQTEGTLFHIHTANPYPEDYRECTDVAQKEKNENARPEIVGSVENMSNYDVIFLGYPNWWGDMPMAVYTFLESYDFSGKTIVPFCTHEGSGLSSTVKSIGNVCGGAEVLDGLAIRGKTAQESEDEAKKAVTDWLNKLDFVN